MSDDMMSKLQEATRKATTMTTSTQQPVAKKYDGPYWRDGEYTFIVSGASIGEAPWCEWQRNNNRNVDDNVYLILDLVLAGDYNRKHQIVHPLTGRDTMSPIRVQILQEADAILGTTIPDKVPDLIHTYLDAQVGVYIKNKQRPDGKYTTYTNIKFLDTVHVPEQPEVNVDDFTHQQDQSIPGDDSIPF